MENGLAGRFKLEVGRNVEKLLHTTSNERKVAWTKAVAGKRGEVNTLERLRKGMDGA